MRRINQAHGSEARYQATVEWLRAIGQPGWQMRLVGPLRTDHILGATRNTKESPASD